MKRRSHAVSNTTHSRRRKSVLDSAWDHPRARTGTWSPQACRSATRAAPNAHVAADPAAPRAPRERVLPDVHGAAPRVQSSARRPGAPAPRLNPVGWTDWSVAGPCRVLQLTLIRKYLAREARRNRRARLQAFWSAQKRGPGGVAGVAGPQALAPPDQPPYPTVTSRPAQRAAGRSEPASTPRAARPGGGRCATLLAAAPTLAGPPETTTGRGAALYCSQAPANPQKGTFL